MAFGTAQGNTVRTETAARFDGGFSGVALSANDAHLSGVRALSERVPWFFVGETLTFRASAARAPSVMVRAL